jgi:hypothetical protein
MKKTFFISMLIVISATSIFATKTYAVNDKVLKIFNETFPEVRQPIWNTFDKYYEVYFTKPDNLSYRIDYDFDGKVIQTMRYYDGINLPAFIKSKVSEKYPNKKIAGVTEVNSDTEFGYHIILEDDKNIYNVKSDPTGNISLESKLIKS